MPRLIEASGRQLQPRSVDADRIAQLEKGTELVDREDVLDAIGQSLRDVSGVVGERLRRVAIFPAAAVVLQHLRQVPVIERRKRLNAVGEQFVDQATVEVQAFRIRCAGPLRKDARPGDREAVGLDAERLHQLHVFLVAVVVVVGHVAVGVVDDLCRACARRCPRPTACGRLPNGAFDLVRGRRGTPQKALRERSRCGGHAAAPDTGAASLTDPAAADAPTAAAPTTFANSRRETELGIKASRR